MQEKWKIQLKKEMGSLVREKRVGSQTRHGRGNIHSLLGINAE
jgi:hypothetical protein